MKRSTTERGFARYDFNDTYSQKCSLQKSSSCEDRIWLGVDTDMNGNDCTRMHLSRQQVKDLLPLLKAFVKIGSI
jgi:hypothetical protein